MPQQPAANDDRLAAVMPRITQAGSHITLSNTSYDEWYGVTYMNVPTESTNLPGLMRGLLAEYASNPKHFQLSCGY
jgi:hypothetical protein